MGNKTYAKEWMTLAGRNLETARLLIRENHFTDIIAFEIQQVMEKSFKAVFAFHGEKIPKTHSLQVLYNFVQKTIELKSITIDDIIIISDYYETQRYPGPKYFLPSLDEVQHSMKIAEIVFNQILFYIESSC
ncbi:HEPN domain-containing protein [Anaerophaga thermohalophila]|uniref:HEPN domain-containing protein n=1 Tax=Anaerophaga thermohalophila TaxID=177400 RepID=UPI00031CEAAC|nr:HEPN domain-containing protein [Anaerophaga thermohalophila]